MIKAIFTTVGVVVVLLVGITEFTLNWSYADGERVSLHYTAVRATE